MMIGRVRGTVVSSTKHPSLDGLKLLIVQPVDPRTLEDAGLIEVVADAAQAGDGEIVMCVRGSSARMTDQMAAYPVDYTAVAILDSIEMQGRMVFRK